MKKLFFSSFVFFAMLMVGLAENFSFLNARSVVVTNGIPVTNFWSLASSAATNRIGQIYTNTAGVRVIVTNAATGRVNLLGDVTLQQFRTDRKIQTPSTNDFLSPTLVAKIAGSTTGGMYYFHFTPMFGDIEDAGVGYVWPVTVPASTVLVTNLPLPLSGWLGASSVRLRSMWSTNVAAASAITVLRLEVSGLVD